MYRTNNNFLSVCDTNGDEICQYHPVHMIGKSWKKFSARINALEYTDDEWQFGNGHVDFKKEKIYFWIKANGKYITLQPILIDIFKLPYKYFIIDAITCTRCPLNYGGNNGITTYEQMFIYFFATRDGKKQKELPEPSIERYLHTELCRYK
jgi:hypothetical protein